MATERAPAVTAKRAHFDDLRARVRGEVIGPEDAAYETARRVFNAMIDRRPALIVRCRDVADVIAAVRYAGEHDLPIAIRGGAHNVAGFGTCDDGVVVDLSPMRGVRYERKTHAVTVEGGCTWGDVDHATHVFGRAVPGGIISTTGVAGLTLGGGMGYLTRKYGLSCDNLLSADVVTAEGALVTASEKENEDLFWALRGGGGNFGIVTSFAFGSHPAWTVVAGPILWPLETAGAAMRFYRDYMAEAPEELNALWVFLKVPPGPPFPAELHHKILGGAVVCYAGPLGNAERAIRPLREFGSPIVADVSPMPYPVLQSSFDGVAPPGLQNWWKGDFVPALTDGLIDAHLAHAGGIPTFTSGVHTFPLTGAAQRVGRDETAYSYRDAAYGHVVYAVYPDPADTPRNRDWVRAYWDDLHRHAAAGSYVNFMMDEGVERVAAAYRDHLPRLREIKAKYDPRNRFRVNQNILPKR